ncbi:Hachiman antiphage defense system protein HamA [Listeria seeligeri]|uniref:Hachiman antiphage defense system protein HamA n=1 Tax=Listeria seeligeri TaxID=1640 RepID=UPI001625EF60|nr:Hachiman antiphage defense system protein HamA [Listeria seeligeri]MBC1527428.1 DUF1837 domain-containing protein [Listeria seeligeri]MBC1731659.1 DUF1837 domain-containing protein [Listeria seeligeri]MBC1809486.1 DUF1837 domain-containing protein [Listeria seeligeri]MBC1894284.1 DUF1837 domain-containing protein [Listeria seeligeri]MBC1942086.1 DUF1837 domain-containing protein [Listeria seeligeri]
MQVLLHYTVKSSVFNHFNKDSCNIINEQQIMEINNFYEKYNKYQEHLFLIICYTSQSKTVEYVIGNIQLNTDGNYLFYKVAEEIQNEIIHSLGLESTNTYDSGVFFKENILDDTDKFKNKQITDFANKIRLRYFDWDELINNNDVLFEKINSILFDQTAVLDIASSYNPGIRRYEDRILQKKYYDALQAIGFISKEGINIELPVLHGDIGEFLMHYLVSDYISTDKSLTYLYPKLVLKSNPKMPVFGNDGTIYIPEKKEIYYLEAKFYKSLATAIDRATDSLKEHNEVVGENIQHKVELFRNIKTKNNDEIIEITEDVKEKLVLFLMCDNIYDQNDVIECIENNNKLNNLKKEFEVIIFIFPILSKQRFLERFKHDSILKGEQYYV